MSTKNVGNTLRLFQVRFEGEGFLGKANIELPDITFKAESMNTGVGDVEVLHSLEAMEAKVMLEEVNPHIYKQLTGGSGSKRLTATGSYNVAGGGTQAVEVVMEGEIKTLETSNFTRGEAKVEESFAITINKYYRHSVNGTPTVEVNHDSLELIINGVDLLAEHRRNIGL